MAEYYYNTYVKEVHGQDNSIKFNEIHHPGNLAPHSGIYRCQNCGHEAVSTKGNRLPSQDTHTHPARCGRIEWKLVVSTNNP